MYAEIKKKGKPHFFNHLLNRIVLLIVITFLPILIVMICVVGFALVKASDQIQEASKRELDVVMNQIETSILTANDEMDEFVLEYLSELSTAGRNEEITAYRMIGDLGKILQKTDLPGIVYLYDRNDERTYMKFQKLSDSLLEIEKMKKEINDFEADYTLLLFADSEFVVKTYSYHNYLIGFGFDFSLSLKEDLLNFLQEGNEIFCKIDDKVYSLDGNELKIANLTWDSCREVNIKHSSTVWEGAQIPLAVSVRSKSIQAWQLVPSIYWLFLIGAVIGVLAVPFFWWALKKEILHPLDTIQKAMREIQEDHLDYRIVDYSIQDSSEMIYLYESFNVMAAEVEKSREKDVQMLRTQLDNLRLQVNPHMLLNSLNMIYSLAQTKNYVCIQEYALHLVDYFRYVLRKNDDMVPMKQELKFLESYIQMMKIRFPGTFTCVYNLEDHCEEALIPPLLIQNFVENAMKYALVPGKTIEIFINVRKENDRLLISICDTGKGIRPEILEAIERGEPYIDKMGNKHIGIWNCIRRVEVFFGENPDMNISSVREQGTQVWLNLPFREGGSVNETFDRG